MTSRLPAAGQAGVRVQTSHVQLMIVEAGELARVVHGQGQLIDAEGHELDALQTIDVLERAAVRLQHAAAELLEERATLMGWRQ